MAERATQMEAMTYVTAGEIFLAAPKRYLPTTNDPDDPPGVDRSSSRASTPVSRHWRACITLSAALHIATLELANPLRKRAGLAPVVNGAGPEPAGNRANGAQVGGRGSLRLEQGAAEKIDA